MKKLVLAVVLFATNGCALLAPVQAARVMKDDNGNLIRLTDDPCTSIAGVFANISAATRKTLKAGSVYWQGKNYEACWTEMDGEYDLVVDETGDSGAVPKAALKRETEI